MSLKRRMVVVSVSVFLILCVLSFLFGYYQARAETLSQDLQEKTEALINEGVTNDLAPKIVCIVFNALTGVGEPIPPLASGECPASPLPSPPSVPACADRIDNDGDGLIDRADPGCTDSSDTDETDAPAPPGPPPPPPAPEPAPAPTPPAPACSDGADNDADTLVDLADPGCTNAEDTDESDPPAGSSPPPQPPSPPAPSPSGGSGGGSPASPLSIGSGSMPSAAAVPLATTTSAIPPEAVQSCDQYLTAFIRTGKENDVDQVKRLQRFLRDFEGANVAENGIYDSVTLAAVHAFQTTYSSDILAPWGARASTGYVYLTTRKKVNEIFCRFTKTFLLTSDELRKIVETRALAEAAQRPLLSERRSSTEPRKMQIENVIAKKQPSIREKDGRSTLQRALDFVRGVLSRSRE